MLPTQGVISKFTVSLVDGKNRGKVIFWGSVYITAPPVLG